MESGLYMRWIYEEMPNATSCNSRPTTLSVSEAYVLNGLYVSKSSQENNQNKDIQQKILITFYAQPKCIGSYLISINFAFKPN